MRTSICLSIVVLSLLIIFKGNASGDDRESFSFEAYIDSYFAYDTNTLPSRIRPYTTQAYVDKEPQINLSYLSAKYESNDFRGRVAFQEGTSVDANYAAEPHEFWQYVQEAVAGINIAPNLWFDAGIYLSHIGFESWISRDNWNYTRSLIAEYSPYYESGGKLTWQASDETALQFHVVNGWQNISDKRHPMFGIQVTNATFKPFTVTYSNCVGDENYGRRFYNDFITRYDFSDEASVAAIFDIGSQEIRNESSDAIWFGWALLGRYQLTPTLVLGVRGEQFSDPHAVVAASLGPDSFRTFGLSINLDVTLYEKLVWRNEVRSLLSGNDIFPDGEDFGRNDTLLVTSLTYTFAKITILSNDTSRSR